MRYPRLVTLAAVWLAIIMVSLVTLPAVYGAPQATTDSAASLNQVVTPTPSPATTPGSTPTVGTTPVTTATPGTTATAVVTATVATTPTVAAMAVAVAATPAPVATPTATLPGGLPATGGGGLTLPFLGLTLAGLFGLLALVLVRRIR